jgi:hypothetical protein
MRRQTFTPDFRALSVNCSGNVLSIPRKTPNKWRSGYLALLNVSATNA